ncbi:MAG: DUF120 domain-containing protein [Thermoplasmata archaeon]|nr:DUF120 domain-containing protein [Thermoplasmata archaeon]
MTDHRSLDVEVLKHIALMGGMSGEIRLTSMILARALGLTQQGASKRLIGLEERGWVERRKAPRAQYVRITSEGKGVLTGEYASYRRIFSPISTVELGGHVVSGMGRGQFFLSLPYYQEKLKELLGYVPFEGTLNVDVDPEDVDKLSVLRGAGGHRIEGFTKGGRSFGAAVCFQAEICTSSSRSVECALILPFKSRYWNVVELLSEHHLRRSLKLEDGARVQVVVQL